MDTQHTNDPDTAEKLLCEHCGWTVGMACPECARGCGCETSCSGWRHDEYRHDDDVDEDVCFECGGDGSNGYGCNC